MSRGKTKATADWQLCFLGLSLKGGTGNRGTGNWGISGNGEYRGIFKTGNIGESLKRGISGNL